MAGDTWSKSRSERLLRQQLTLAHAHKTTKSQPHFRHKYAQLSGADEDHSQNTRPRHTHPHPPLPWVSLTPFLPHAHASSDHTCTHKVAGRQHAVHVALWRIITQQCRLKSREWTSSSSDRASSSVWHQPPIKHGQNSSWMLLCMSS